MGFGWVGEMSEVPHFIFCDISRGINGESYEKKVSPYDWSMIYVHEVPKNNFFSKVLDLIGTGKRKITRERFPCKS